MRNASKLIDNRYKDLSVTDLTPGIPTLDVNIKGNGAALPSGTNTIGKVDQGVGGASAWKVDGSAVTQPVSGPLTDTQLRAAPVPILSARYSTITNSRPTVTTSSTLILAANASRKYAGGFNQSGGVIYVKFGAAAVAGEGIRVTNNDPIIIPDGFTGEVYAIRNAGTGAVEMAEGT